MNRTKLDPKTCTIAIGQRVHCGLYGGNDGIVTAIHGEQRPGTMGQLGAGVSYGGNAYFDVLFDDHVSKMLPECILRGVQWDIYDCVASAEDISELRAEMLAHVERERLKKIAADDQFAAAVEDLKANEKYSKLHRADKHSGGTHCAKNIRIELKAAFPGVKFSVKSDYNSVNIYWTNGPTAKQVEAIANKYKQGSYNGMEDIYEYSPDAWNAVFGGCKYVFTSREVTFDARKAAFNHHFPKGWNGIAELTEKTDVYGHENYHLNQAIFGTPFLPAPEGIQI